MEERRDDDYSDVDGLGLYYGYLIEQLQLNSDDEEATRAAGYAELDRIRRTAHVRRVRAAPIGFAANSEAARRDRLGVVEACGLCFEPMTVGNEVVVVGCSHSFCACCAIGLANTASSACIRCPFCRAEVARVAGEQITGNILREAGFFKARDKNY